MDGLDPIVVHDAVSDAAARARKGEGPTLIEVRVSRMTPHSSDDDDRSYRTREEVEMMKASDPLPVFGAHLLNSKVIGQTELDHLNEQAIAEVDDAVEHAEAAPYPEVAEAMYPVYVEDIRHG